MRYTYVQAIAKPKVRGARWVEVDFQNILLKDLLNNYRDAQIEVTHPSLTSEQYLELNSIRDLVSDLSITFDAWLISLGNASLPTVEGKPMINTVTVDHRDAFMAGFNIEPTRMGSHPENEWASEQKIDLLLTRDNTDYQAIYNNCLVSVNGLLRQTSYSDSGLYVINGGQSRFESNQTNVALTDFSAVGGLQLINITKEMLYRPQVESKHYRYAHLNLGVDTESKTVILVLGGYLHVLDSVYKEIGNGLIQIDFNNYPFIQRYYDSRSQLDLSTMENDFESFDHNESQRSVDELLRSEATIEHFLSLPETFAVVVDTPNLYVDQQMVERSGLPGIFFINKVPRLPLMTQRGKLKEYWAQEDDGRWVISCESNLVPNYQFEHTHYETLASVTDHKIPSQPFYADRGFLLEIGKDL
jgi:hypothetical protein